eukprot:scaffold88429_cov21-Tisochrysis_lutea.AAC.5
MALRYGITRAHLEEDSGKTVYGGADRMAGSEYSLVDFNRAVVQACALSPLHTQALGGLLQKAYADMTLAMYSCKVSLRETHFCSARTCALSPSPSTVLALAY